MKLTLVRHTSLAIAPRLCYGQSDVQVSENFELERQKLQLKLANSNFDAIYASPLQRCHQLAQALCADASLGFSNHDIQLDERLKELHFGDWEMQPDGTFVLHTLYDRAAAEERIWFGTPDLRMRCSIIKTQGGKGVLTASLSTEVCMRV